MCSIDLGIIPLKCVSNILPNILCVFPLPVYPYAKIVPLYPFKTSTIVFLPTMSYNSFYVLVGVNTLSNV